VKISRIIAAGAGIALVGASTILIGGSANAAGGATAGNPSEYVAASAFTTEGASYPAGWFKGTPATGSIPGTVFTSAADGLEVDGAVQILNGTPGTGTLTDLVTGAGLGVVTGDAWFQIPLYENGTAQTGFTTLRPANPGDAGLTATANWVTSQALGAYPAGATASLQDFQAALPADYRILAFGAFVPTGAATISSITWNGTTYRFTPTPTATLSPTSLDVTDYATPGKGVTGTFTGFLPGEAVDAVFADANSGGPIPGSYTADANGAVTINYVETDSAADVPGAYRLGAQGEVSGVLTTAAFTVTADPAGSGAGLAFTGSNPTPLLVAAAVLLLAGLAFWVVSLRRRGIGKS
jgi:hypothetical protein